MVKNVRWLYNKLGTADISATGSDTISGSINAVQNNIDGKANASHTHGVGELPVSNSSVNSTSYVPSSAVVYSLKSTMSDLSAEVSDLDNQVSNIPNTRYGNSVNLGTWSSISDADEFLTRFNHSNLYSDSGVELALGNYITINNGSYTSQWEIAGFDMEHNQTAADGTVYDNGYGICLILRLDCGYYSIWNRTPGTVNGGYISSYIHNDGNGVLLDYIGSVLGSHLIKRNVLLSNSVDSTSRYSNGYEWTTVESTLMSVGQMTGTFASHNNKYDDGEANYKLPLFDYEKYWKWGDGTSAAFWLRNIYGWYNYSEYVYFVRDSSTLDKRVPSDKYSYAAPNRPMIYIR